ncbi:hypothetical protein [Yoonia sp. R2-816]|uniref:hypothetical protein n=1 Tax=Yoonia sp. R2-816 TaxID=3342638 RepID=UPI0037293795
MTSTNDEGLAALESMAMPDITPGDADADGPQQVDDDGNPVFEPESFEPEKLTKDAFWAAFKAAFQLGSVMFPGGPLPQLAIQPHEQDHARAASDATYDLLDAYAPFFLDSGRDQLMLFMTAGSFFFLKAKVVQMAVLERRAERMDTAQASRHGPRPQPRRPSRAEPVGEVWEMDPEEVRADEQG